MAQAKNEVKKQDVPKGILVTVERNIKAMTESGNIHFPQNYSAQNALNSAWLKIQETKNKDHKFALDVCTKESVATALLNTVILGLSPAKNQVYYIVYGNQLKAAPGYLGQVAATKRLKGVVDVFAQCVYKDDTLEYIIEDGKKIITKHVQKLENIDNSKIIAAYGTIIYTKEKDPDQNRPVLLSKYSEIMTLAEIKQAWEQSPTHPITDKGNIKADSTHGKFTQEMAKKTVLNRTCKMFLNTSDDSDLLITALKEMTNNIEPDIEEIIGKEANGEVIDITDMDEVKQKVTPTEEVPKEDPQDSPSDLTPDF